MSMQLQGYYENGNYFFNNPIEIPHERSRVTVIFHDIKDTQSKKIATIKGILSDALNAENELTTADWEDMKSIRNQTNAGLSRRVDL